MSDFSVSPLSLLIFWLSLISLLTVIFTVYDKIAAKKNPKKRVPENTLIYMGVLGGAAAEYLTMLLIRHKTKHNKFMLGLPVIVLIQCAAAAAIYFIKIKR